METTLLLTFLVALVAGRLYAGKVAAEFIASLPADERARVQAALSRGTC